MTENAHLYLAECWPTGTVTPGRPGSNCEPHCFPRWDSGARSME